MFDTRIPDFEVDNNSKVCVRLQSVYLQWQTTLLWSANNEIEDLNDSEQKQA